jgi:hypothetical protein
MRLIHEPKESIEAAAAKAKMGAGKKINRTRTTEQMEALFKKLAGERKKVS